MRSYSWASITNNINYGNRLIEYNLENILKQEGFNKPAFSFDCSTNEPRETREIIDQINKTNFLIVPGCTTLTLKHYPTLQKILPEIKVPVYNIAAAFSGKESEPDIEELKYFEKPIATRDSFTNEYLTRKNIQNIFTGCPTLFSGNAEKICSNEKSKQVLVFLGFKNVEPQLEIVDYLLTSGYQVKAIIQEDHQHKFLENKNIEKIDFDPATIIDEIKKSKLVVTARLHGALPSLACGTPIIFLKAMNDFRFSLLEWLEVKEFNLENVDVIECVENSIKDYPSLIENEKEIYNKIKQCRSNLLHYIRSIK